MKRKLTVMTIMLAFLFAGITGCGGGQKEILAPEQAKVVQTTSVIPEEYTAPNKNPDVVVGKGTSVSKDMQIAVNKANLQATNEIANFMNSKAVSLRENISREDVESEDFEAMYKETISQASSQVIQGAEETFRKIIPDGTNYRAYVILQLPIGKANKVLLQGLKKNEELWRMVKDLEQVKEMERKVKEFEESQKQG